MVTTPGDIKIGDKKTIYVVQPNGLYLPIQVVVDKNNIKALQRM